VKGTPTGGPNRLEVDALVVALALEIGDAAHILTENRKHMEALGFPSSRLIDWKPTKQGNGLA